MLGAIRALGPGGLARGMPAVAVVGLVSAAALAGGSAQVASGYRGGAGGSMAAGIISTVAGGVGGPGSATKVGTASPVGVTFSGGYLYVADGGSVRKVSLATGRLTTPAGTGAVAPLGDGGLAMQAGMDDASGIAGGPSGSLLIADRDPDNGRVRMMAESTGTFYGQPMIAGHIYTVAGGGHGGDSGPATGASLADPSGVAVDAAGNLLIAEFFGYRVRVVAASTGAFYGQQMTAGDIYTIAGNGTIGSTGDGGPATGAQLESPMGVAVDGTGNVLIAESSRIRVVAASTGTFYGQQMTAGDIYTIAGGGTGGLGDGGSAIRAELGPSGVTLDAAGNVLIADSGNNRIRVVAKGTGTFYGRPMTAGDIYTVAGDGTQGFAGDGGPAAGAELGGPRGIAADSAGNLLIGDTGNNRVRVVAESAGTFYGKAMTAGHIYTVAGNGTGVYDNDLGTGGFSGDGGPAAHAELGQPLQQGQIGIAVDGAGNLVIADSGNNRIRVVAKGTGTFYGRPMTAGRIYTVAGNGTEGFSGDRGPATSAELNFPGRVAVDGAGNLVIADTYNERVRVVAESAGSFYGKAMTAGHIYTVAGNGTAGHGGGGGLATAAELYDPAWVTVDSAGNLVIADTFNYRIRVVAATTGTYYGHAMTAGHIYGVAGDGHAGGEGDGGPAVRARLRTPTGVAVDGSGNLLIADTGNNRIRLVAATTGTYYGQAMTVGHLYTVAGAGGVGFSGDGGPATSAELNGPTGVAVSATGNLLIADTDNCRIRVVAERADTFFGQPMTAGDIYTVAGSNSVDGSNGCLGGNSGFSGDGGPATSAELSFPSGVTASGAGNLLFADSFNGRIRRVTG